MKLTHNVAVVAYMVKDGKFLFLLRNTPPKIWALPGGHLLPGEDPEAGIKREVKEETGLTVKPIVPIDIWFGEWNGEHLLAIDYYVEIIGGNLRLSDEHTQYAFVSPDELRKGKPFPLDASLKLTPDDLDDILRKIACLNG